MSKTSPVFPRSRRHRRQKVMAGPREDRKATFQLALKLALIIGITAITFARVVPNGFVAWDDEVNIFKYPAVARPTLRSLTILWRGPYQQMYIPLTYTAWWSLAIVAQTSTPDATGARLNPAVFHGANVLVHAASAVAVFLLLRRIVKNEWAACVGALVFALHPIQTEPVAWATGMKDVLSGMLVLFALVQYLEFAQSAEGSAASRRHYGFATLLLVLGLLSKPAAVVAPLLAALLDLTVVRRPPRRVVLSLVPWLLLCVTAVGVATWSQPTETVDAGPLWARPLIAADAIAFYLVKVACPVSLAPIYCRTPAAVLSSGAAWWTWLAPTGVAVALWRVKSRQLWIAAGWFVLAMLPVSGLLAFGYQEHSTTADRYLYLSMAGIALASAWAVDRWRDRRATPIAASAILVLLAITTCRQAGYWKDTFTLFKHDIEVAGANRTALYQMGQARAEMGQWNQASRLLEQTLQIDPAYASAHYSLGLARQQQGRIDDAIAEYRQSILLRPGKADAYVNLGALLADRGDSETALQLHRRAVSLEPGDADAWINLGLDLANLGRSQEAEQSYRTALGIDPDRPEAHLDLVGVLLRLNRVDKAVAEAGTAVRLDPSSADARFNLALALERAGRLNEAEAALHEAARLHGDDPEIRGALARLAALRSKPR